MAKQNGPLHPLPPASPNPTLPAELGQHGLREFVPGHAGKSAIASSYTAAWTIAHITHTATAGMRSRYMRAGCAKQGTPARRYLAELEMKLQLLSEDVEAALADSSSRALQRIPVAVQEVSRIKARSWEASPNS